MATEREVGRLITAVMPLFANYKPPANDDDALALVKAWHMVIGHLEPDVLSGALRAAVTRTQFFPTPSLVLECAVELTTAPKRTGLEAWNEVQQAIAEHGVYHPPNGAQYGDFKNDYWTFSDPLLNKLVDGPKAWVELCMSENQIADRARIIDSYEKAQQRAGEQARLTPDLVKLQSGKRAEALQLMAGLADREGQR